MIDHLSGKIIKKTANFVIISAQGVGYGVAIGPSTFCDLPKESNEVELWIHTRVREDALNLYGFCSYEDKLTFEILLSVNKVGPKVALAILSVLSRSDLLLMLETEDTRILETVPGIGKTLAHKILFELKSKKSKIAMLDVSMNQKFNPQNLSSLEPDLDTWHDISSALENLGYKNAEVQRCIKHLRGSMIGGDFSTLLKAALASLQQGKLHATSQEKAPLEIF